MDWLRFLIYSPSPQRRRHYEHRHRHIPIVIFSVNGVSVRLHPHISTLLMITVNVGHQVECTIEELDQNGNPMLTPVAPGSAPVWTDTPSTPPVDTFTPAPDGSSALLVATAVGADTVNVTAVYGGKT